MESGFHLYRPGRFLPLVYRPAVLAAVTERLRLRNAARLLRRRGARRVVLYLWRPEFHRALDLMPDAPVCYHIDDEYTFSDADRPIPPDELRLLHAASQVIIHSPALLEKKGHFNPRTLFVPNGVDYRAYAEPSAEPADLKPVPHPRAGYVGVLKQQLDFALLLALAQRHADWSFVFVGPRKSVAGKAPLIEQLERLPNAHFLGGKAVDELPAYTQHFDVGMMCYEITDYTNSIYPLKLHEYLASGRPVVGTPIRTLLEFEHVVTLARTPDEWSAALTASLSAPANSPDAVEMRRAVARQHDWTRLTRVIARSLCELLGPEDVARFDAIAPAAPC